MTPEVMGSSGKFFITCLVSLFVIIDPPGNLFPFLSLSGGCPPRLARKLARRACGFAFVILLLFIVAGQLIISILGISLAAFQITGGLVLFRIAFDMLEARGHFNRLDTSSSLQASDYQDIALVPLAVPLLSGPGAISTVLVLTSRAATLQEEAILVVALGLILTFTYLFFRFAEVLLNILTEVRIRLLTRLMGLILAALAVEFVLRGFYTAFPSWSQ